ncbi:MAG: hypothetical protein UU82_C0036G0002 [Candidatus Nomurabacteria bacterium GW2011_GWC2_41_8]|uniref:Uncharacterized protein n=1 Tax=Candidatus Nomurabacteria bacterium GW2011_GWC2_41_8 TaxID=1618755 RepID=A0A0G1AD96_9BACT|nr:MAG: hypothetical protein UU82_C0036G0002 [Candidatus Nomurabacteria bacterium GW2011_GWC2_41_8]
MIEPLRSYNPFDILNSIYEFILDLIMGRGSSYLSNYFFDLYDKYGYSLILLSMFLSSALVVFIMYVIFRINGIYSKQRKSLSPIKNAAEEKKEETVKSEKWKIITEHIESENVNDWRLAILEADIILGEMLDKLGYRGEGIGEQLKSVDKSDFTAIDDAWEAHKIRNSIAHEGSSFLITEREAKRVIGLYKKVFEEHNYI